MIKFLYVLYTPFVVILAKISGVKLGYKVLFCGSTSFRIRKGSTIKISDSCRFMSLSVGNRVGLNHKCMLSTEREGATLRIGRNCSFSGVSVWCFKSIILGNNVRVGANCLLMDGDAHQDDPRSGEDKSIIIEDNVWLGGNVIVKKGVTIGRNSVIGMNSVVTKDIPANSLAIGNPCVVVKYFDETKINEIEEYFK